MPGMRDQFAHFYMLDEDAVTTAMLTGLIVPDTNVLLNLYRFRSKARDELFAALNKLNDRLWVPHQVALEFHRNRLEVIAQQEKFFRDTRGELDSSIAALRRKISSFQTRLALAKDDLREITDGIDALQKLIQKEVGKAEKANEVRLKDRDSDKVLARLEKLLGNRVGGQMEPEELEEARAEAERRAQKQIPPGYMDADKVKGDPAGDYLIWRQLKSEAAKRKIPVVLITDDEKEDWVRREHDVPLGARYELREEMTREAGVSLLMMTTEEFLRHAKIHLNATVSEETVGEAKEITATANIFWDDGRDPVEAVLDILHEVALAEEPGVITYTELSQRLKVHYGMNVSPRGLAPILGEASMREETRGRGMISVLVVSAATGLPSSGFFRLARTAPFDRQGDDLDIWLSEYHRVRSEHGLRPPFLAPD